MCNLASSLALEFVCRSRASYRVSPLVVHQKTGILDHRSIVGRNDPNHCTWFHDVQARTEARDCTGLNLDAKERVNIRMGRGTFELALDGTAALDFIAQVRQE